MSDLEDAITKCLTSDTYLGEEPSMNEATPPTGTISAWEISCIESYYHGDVRGGCNVCLLWPHEADHLVEALRRTNGRATATLIQRNREEIRIGSISVPEHLWWRAIHHLKDAQSTGDAGGNDKEGRVEDMTDYTNRVETELRDRDVVNGKIDRTKKEIIRAISSNVSDLAGIHTDDDGNLDRFALGASLDKSLRAVAFQVEDMADIDDE